MGKFSKELEALIPEWEDSFVNYCQLKKQIKLLKASKHTPNILCNAEGEKSETNQAKNVTTQGEIEVGDNELANLYSNEDEAKNIHVQGEVEVDDCEHANDKDEIRAVENDNEDADDDDEIREVEDDSEEAKSITARGEIEKDNIEDADNNDDDEIGLAILYSKEDEVKEFLEKLDEELNKVNKFYNTKESEFLERGEILNKQLQILLDLKKSYSSSSRSSGSGRRRRIRDPEEDPKCREDDYRAIGLLKTYSSLNMVAFEKILKKVDKAVKLMDEVECIFTMHFTNGDKQMAMKFLKPQHNKDSHMVTFFIGLCIGIFVALFAVYAILAHNGIFSTILGKGYLEAVYPIFSMFALLSLHMFCYGCNLFTWKSTRINYNFIFNFQPSTALAYRDAFFISTCMMTTVILALSLHLLLRASRFLPHQVDYIPGVLLLSIVALLICPLNIFYRPTRYCFLRVMRNIVCSPFYKVLMVDVFMADQLTSQIPFLRHMESTACYFVASSFKTHLYSTCKSGKLYRELAYVISFTPYYWRAMQCARRLFDEGDTGHLVNMGKYVSTLVAAGARITYARQPTPIWMAIALVTSVVATVYQLYWDFIKDWGLLRPNSKNPCLRNELVLKKKGFYYIAIALNFLLRVAWVESVLQLNIGLFKSQLLDFILASVEIIRRGQWNYYRLENEHLHNVGKSMPVKMVPLPFHETESNR